MTTETESAAVEIKLLRHKQFVFYWVTRVLTARQFPDGLNSRHASRFYGIRQFRDTRKSRQRVRCATASVIRPPGPALQDFILVGDFQRAPSGDRRLS
jgi:hypothetical protein